MNTHLGMVTLVGAGPGDPELITVKGQRALRAADVVLFDRLIPHELLALAPPTAELIDVSKAPRRVSKSQDQTNALLVEHARRGKHVVRLKGGDPFIYARGSEEMAACREAGIACVAIPGVSSAFAVPAAAGIPVTERALSRSVAVITGQTKESKPVPAYDYRALAAIDTVIILMGVSNLRALLAHLVAGGRDPHEPAAIVVSGTLPEQRVVRGTVATLPDLAHEAEVRPPAVVVIGAVARHADVQRAVSDLTSVKPLRDRRIALTQALGGNSELRRGLHTANATIVDLPLIRIAHPDKTPKLDEALRTLHTFDWITFTSVNGVRGVWRRLTALGFDARRFAGCRIAAVGPGTARELQQRGIAPDLVPQRHAADGLVASLGPHVHGARVLYPQGSHALPTLRRGLEAAGAEVVGDVVYHTEANTPTEEQLARFRQGVEAILFASPSAVQQHAALGLPLKDMVVACIGPTTAQVAEELGFPVDLVPTRPGSGGLIAALEAHFADAERPRYSDAGRF